jgi:hypothetical protein
VTPPLGRAAAVGAAAVAAAALAGTARAPASDGRAAIAAVRGLIGAHATVCRLSVRRLRATRLGDPLDLAHTLAYRIDAELVRGRDTAFAAWEVAAGVVTPVSPLAGEIGRGCSLRDPARRAGWRSLPYFDYDGGGLDVPTSTAWRGAARVGSASLTSEVRPLWSQPLQPIWAAACRAGAQRVTFTRTLFLPGRPAAAAIAFRTTSAFVRSLELRVNGSLATRVSGRGGYRQLGAHARRLFRYGANMLALSATKGPSPACNGGGVGVAVAAELTGRFRADLGLPPSRRFSIPQTARDGDYFYRRADGAASGAFSFTIVNGGPSAIPAATFVAHVGAEAPVALLFPGRRCRRRDATSGLAPPYGTLCIVRDLQAGRRIRLRAVYRFRPRLVPFDEAETYITWEVRGPNWDANPHNQQHTVTLTFCGTRATSADCARAP